MGLNARPGATCGLLPGAATRVAQALPSTTYLRELWAVPQPSRLVPSSVPWRRPTWAPPISQGWCKRQNLWSSAQLHLWNATLTTRRARSLSPPILWYHWLFLILHLRVLMSKLRFREKHKTLPLILPTTKGDGKRREGHLLKAALLTTFSKLAIYYHFLTQHLGLHSPRPRSRATT